MPVTWLGADNALGVLAALDVWRNVGYWAMFFVAAIIGLPEELYQAAELDGASVLARFAYLTLPLLRRIIFFAVVVSTIWALQVFDTALVLTDGGPGTRDHHGHLPRLALRLRLQQQGRLRRGDLAGADRRDPGPDADPDAPAARPAGRRLMTGDRRARCGRARWPLRRASRRTRAAQAPAASATTRAALRTWRDRGPFILVAPFYYVVRGLAEGQHGAIFTTRRSSAAVPALFRQLRAAALRHRLPALDVQHAVRGDAR